MIILIETRNINGGSWYGSLWKELTRSCRIIIYLFLLLEESGISSFEDYYANIIKLGKDIELCIYRVMLMEFGHSHGTTRAY